VKTAIDILQSKWRHADFRPQQKEIIDAVLAKKNCIALLPTGGGKSLCYQIPALLQEGLCLVVSPLLALMQDQVESLHKKNIKAALLNSSFSENEMVVLFDNIQNRNYKFLYISPEKLQAPFVQQKIKQLNISLVAIDEAHCISEWGHDFRPSYTELEILKDLCPTANTIALTATATRIVLEDLCSMEMLKEAVLFKSSYLRERLAYQIFEVEDKFFKIKQILTKIKAPAILYVQTRKEAEKTSAVLNRAGFASTYYHGGMVATEKKKAYEEWFCEKKPTMVATNAFGMGIDKPNIRVVIHLQLPYSIENYLQEAGRAGRDGKKAFAVLLKNKSDFHRFEQRRSTQKISIDFIKKVYLKLNQYFYIGKGELIETPFAFNLDDFCQSYQLPSQQTATAIHTLQLQGVLVTHREFQKRASLKFIASSSMVLRYGEQHPALNPLLKTVLRNYGGLFENFVNINEFELAKKNSILKRQVIVGLEKLHKDATLEFLVPREDEKTINRISKRIVKQQNNKDKKAKKLLNFIENNTRCRSQQLLQYFEENDSVSCGICDVCLNNKKQTKKVSKTEKDLLLALLKKEGELSSRALVTMMKKNEDSVLKTVQTLLEEGQILLTAYNTYTLNL
jgi:ATP-dependent DNA helicase RecQ